MHKNIGSNDENIDENLHKFDLQMDLAMQIISNDQTVKNDTKQDLKDFES